MIMHSLEVLHIMEDIEMINQNYEKLMKMNLTKMAELYKNQSTKTSLGEGITGELSKL